MLRSLLVRGMLAGLLAGVLAFGFAYVFGEPQVQKAIDFEEAVAQAHHEHAEAELVSRGTQRTLGLLTGNVLIGVALGGVFALLFAWAYGRVGRLDARATAAMLALAAFATTTLIPFTKYPANPPAVGDPDTVGRRTILFVVMIAVCILAAVAAYRFYARLRQRFDGWTAALVGLAAFAVVVAIAELILPGAQDAPAGFPADVMWNFRLASLGVNATMWATLGIGFGLAAQRLLAREGSTARRIPAPV